MKDGLERVNQDSFSHQILYNFTPQENDLLLKFTATGIEEGNPEVLNSRLVSDLSKFFANNKSSNQENASNPDSPAVSQRFGSDASISNDQLILNNTQLHKCQADLKNLPFLGVYKDSIKNVKISREVPVLDNFDNNRLSIIDKDFSSATHCSSPFIDNSCFIQKRPSTDYNKIASSEVLDCEKSKESSVHSIDSSLAVPGPSGLNRNTLILNGQNFKYVSWFEQQIVAPEDDKQFICPYCEKELETHVVARGRYSRYKCCLCGKVRNFKSYLWFHISEHGPNAFKCRVCGEIFGEKGLHEGEQTCKVCSKKFECKTLLVEHSVTHKWYFECMACRNYIDTHLNQKIYNCCKCDYRTSHGGHLRMHLFKHFSEKPYKCEFCGKRLAHMVSLKLHMKASCRTNNITL